MKPYFIVVICLCITIVSCQKEISFEDGTTDPINNGGNGGNTPLVGVWKLAGMHVETIAENEMDIFGTITRTVTKSVYNTKENTGTFNFTTGLKAITTNMGYSIDTVGMVYTYENSVLQDSMDFPYIPYTSSSSESGYKLVGADSIYFVGGALTIGGGTVNTKPTGMKYTIAGSKLTMNFLNNNDSTLDVGGQIVKTKQQFSGVITMVK